MAGTPPVIRRPGEPVQPGCHPFGCLARRMHAGHPRTRACDVGPRPDPIAGRPTAPRSSAGRPCPAAPATASSGGRGGPSTIAPAAGRPSAGSTVAWQSAAGARAWGAEGTGDRTGVPLVPHWGRAVPSSPGQRAACRRDGGAHGPGDDGDPRVVTGGLPSCRGRHGRPTRGGYSRRATYGGTPAGASSRHRRSSCAGWPGGRPRRAPAGDRPGGRALGGAVSPRAHRARLPSELAHAHERRHATRPARRVLRPARSSAHGAG
jgi:hypothetical protein